MKFTTTIVALALAASTGAVQLRFDNTYDNGGGSMNTVACSTGANGLAQRFPTFGSLPTFPNIGASSDIGGFNSPACGNCYNLTFTFQGVTRSVTVTAIDHAGNGFNVAQPAMDTLTNGNAVALGTIDVQSQQVARSVCGL
ncbi:allergen asp f 15 precursor [Moniliophthora roreri MCA 2997]|uniref:Allergen asp f 15 n=2 Tax=Moniliophthora roreri TaxID=221103 RepID=V2XI84_MONRO|nr:cerato-platanin 2 [Moniliophthora roreri]ESK92200.1 allergen asp f 15 precursor [Moniliophthora roreri MCA 2997]